MICSATLQLGDDYGDNACTMHCQLESDHELPHQEAFDRDGKPVVITWHVDDSDTFDTLDELNIDLDEI